MTAAATYHYLADIPTPEDGGLVPEVAFSPDSTSFAVTASGCNEIMLFDAATLELKRSFSNPECELDSPHAIVLTERHMIVGNSFDPKNRPALISVFALDSDCSRPVFQLNTPVEAFREAHSFSMHGNRLIATYCEGDSNGLLSFIFDDQTGVLSDPVSRVDLDYKIYGEAKGVDFNTTGDHAVVTLVSEKHFVGTAQQRLDRLLSSIRNPRHLAHATRGLTRRLLHIQRKGVDQAVLCNGIAYFPVGPDASIAQQPVEMVLETDYCRLESISIVDELCAITDSLSNSVALYRTERDKILKPPVQVLSEGLDFPHGAAISPDRKTIVVTNYCLKVEEGNPQWHAPQSQEHARLVAFRLQTGKVLD